MDSYKIISVIIVEGSSLNPKWRSPMQKIKTDKGEYIDNVIDAEPHLTPGFDWKSKEGTNVQAKLNFSKGFNWISLKKSQPPIPPDNLITTSKLAKKLGITTKALKQKFISSGFLDEKESLTPRGEEIGGKHRIGEHGPYCMWPENLTL